MKTLKHFLFIPLFLINAFYLKAQLPSLLVQYFDGADTSAFYSLFVTIDPTANNIWQIGKPQKTLFDSADTYPNVIITDSLNFYPVNNTSSFKIKMDFPNFGPSGVYAFRWKQKINMDPGTDFAKVEFTIDSGLTWQSVFNNPNVYNFYGFDQLNVGTLPNSGLAFTGTDTIWKDIWLCFSLSWLSNIPQGHGFIRFTFQSDAINTNKEGWMIDNMMSFITIAHTLGTEQQKDYITIYPNPAKDILYIQARKVKGYHIIEEMGLYDISGKQVDKWSTIPTKFFIDTRKYNNGSYRLKIKTNLESLEMPLIIDHK